MGVEVKPGDVKLIVRAEPGNDTPAIVRLRQAFKVLLRRYGLRVTWASEVGSSSALDERDGCGNNAGRVH